MRSILIIALLAPAIPSFSRSATVIEDSVTRVIDAEVWRPFVQAFNARDAEAYLALHAKNMVRWSLGWSEPQPGDSVRAEIRRHWSSPQRMGEERTIELLFTHRSHTNAFAYDIGYYQVTVVPDEGPMTKHVGLFNVILGKEDGRWKIFLDADNGEGVTKEDLRKGVPLGRD